MSAFSNSQPSVELTRLTLVRKDVVHRVGISPERMTARDRGFGCVRGFAFAMFCNLSLVLLIAAGWEAWHLLR